MTISAAIDLLDSRVDCSTTIVSEIGNYTRLNAGSVRIGVLNSTSVSITHVGKLLPRCQKIRAGILEAAVFTSVFCYAFVWLYNVLLART